MMDMANTSVTEQPLGGMICRFRQGNRVAKPHSCRHPQFIPDGSTYEASKRSPIRNRIIVNAEKTLINLVPVNRHQCARHFPTVLSNGFHALPVTADY